MMKPYEKYLPSGVEWIGDIPEGWEVSKVRFEYTFTTGWTPPTINDDNFYGENKWVNISDLGRNKKIVNTERRISDEAVENSKINKSPIGSLLFSFKLSIGQVAIVDTDLYTNEAIATFTAKNNNCIDFLYYAAPIFIVQNANENIYGAKLLNQSSINSSLILIPDTDTQTAIANYLDRETARIDNIIKAKETLIDRLKEKRTAVITHAVTKGLDPKAKMKPSGVEWIGDIPEGWEVKKISHLYKIFAGGDIPEDAFSFEETNDFNYPIYSNSLMNDGLYGYTDRYRFDGNTITVTGRGDVGFAVPRANKYYPIVRLLVCIPYSELSVNFFAYAINASDKTGEQTAMAQLTTDKLSSLKLPFPPLTIQFSIADYLDTETAQIDTTIEKTKLSIEKLKEYRTAIISACVTGKIDVKILSFEKEEKQ